MVEISLSYVELLGLVILGVCIYYFYARDRVRWMQRRGLYPKGSFPFYWWLKRVFEVFFKHRFGKGIFIMTVLVGVLGLTWYSWPKIGKSIGGEAEAVQVQTVSFSKGPLSELELAPPVVGKGEGIQDPKALERLRQEVPRDVFCARMKREMTALNRQGGLNEGGQEKMRRLSRSWVRFCENR